jgi:transposase
MADHTDRALSRLEVVDTGRRRRWTEEEKLRIVMESLSGSRQVAPTARRHGLSRSLLTKWRRQFQVEVDGAAVSPGFMPAVVVAAGPAQPGLASTSSQMEIVVANGRRVIVEAGVDIAALERVLDLLERRRSAKTPR